MSDRSKRPLRLPPITPAGLLLEPDDETFAAGSILLQRHGGTDLLYAMSAEDALAACAGQGARVLLGHSAQTAADRRQAALANALVMVMLASLPALALGALFGREGGLLVCLAIVLGAAAWGAWKEMMTPGKLWTRSEWIDLDSRTWNARRDFPDHALPPQRLSLPLADLALICFTQHWEQGVSHDVGLCKAAELKTAESREPACLNMLHSADSADAASQFALALARMWGIPCWQVEGGLSIRKRRLG